MTTFDFEEVSGNRVSSQRLDVLRSGRSGTMLADRE